MARKGNFEIVLIVIVFVVALIQYHNDIIRNELTEKVLLIHFFNINL